VSIRKKAVPLIVALALSTAAGCSFGVDLTGFFGGVGGSPDASTVAGDDASIDSKRFDAQALDGAGRLPDASPGSDAGVVKDGGSLEIDAGLADAGSGKCPYPNLIGNGGFEDGLTSWASAGPTTPFDSISGAHRSGGFGLRMCSVKGFSMSSFSARNTQNLPVANYHARAWVRASVAVTGSLPASLGLSYAFQVAPQSIGPVTSAWHCGEVDRSDHVQVIEVSSVSGLEVGCLDIDDVEVFEVPVGDTLPAACRCP
jgi:hypothetical protein